MAEIAMLLLLFSLCRCLTWLSRSG